jgi:hypothetical protein
MAEKSDFGTLEFVNHNGATERFICSRPSPHVVRAHECQWGWLVKYRGTVEDLHLAGVIDRTWLEGMGKSRTRSVRNEFGDKVTITQRRDWILVEQRIYADAEDPIGMQAWERRETEVCHLVNAAIMRAGLASSRLRRGPLPRDSRPPSRDDS